ncbi:hypothetical protein BsWGS_06193 [Bradybaena similaris]
MRDRRSASKRSGSTMGSFPRVDITEANGWPEDRGPSQLEMPGLAGILNPVTLTVVCVTSLVGVVCIIALLWVWTQRRRQKLRAGTDFSNAEDSKTTNSAPVSRVASPKLSKRKSCPGSLSTICPRHSALPSSVKSACIPEIIVTGVHVQPDSPRHTTEPAFAFGTDPQKSHTQLSNYEAYHFQGGNKPQDQEIPQCRLWFSVVYDEVAEKLQISLIQVEELPGRDNSSQPRDPYVKIFLLPDEKTCRVSKVRKKTLNPVFNETHTFQVTTGDIPKRALRFSVYDVDKRRVRHSLGHAVINLRALDLTRGDVIQARLEPTVRTTSSEGELQVSLLYIPPYEKMLVTIHNARYLHYLEDYPGLGAYIQIQLFYGHKCHRIKHTPVHQGGAEITFNENFTFTVSERLLETYNMRISVMLASSTICAANEVEYGRVVLGPFMFARGSELAHWNDMLSRPGFPSTRWHCLTSTTL